MDSTKIKELFVIAGMAVGIILAIILIVWIPFKVIPSLFSGSTNFVASTLTENFIPGKSTSTTPTTSGTKNPVTNTTGSQNTKYYQVYTGKSDLVVELISEGSNNSYGQYYDSNTVNTGNTVIVKFRVRNIGTNVSGNWTLRLNTPDYSTNYDSTHNSINPGDSILFTTTFPAQTPGNYYTYVTVDPQNSIDEVSKGNNSLTVPLTVNGVYNNNNYPNNNYYNNYNYSNLSAYCYASPATAYVGNQVNWYVVPTGGNGIYQYFWQGSDNLYSNFGTASKAYYMSGAKVALVTVTSNGQSVTVQCSANIY